MEWLTIIPGLLTLVGLVVKFLITNKPKHDKEERLKDAQSNIQKSRKALAEDNSDSFDSVASDQHDRVSEALRSSRR